MSGHLSDSNLGATLFVATLFTGVLSLVYPRRFTTWPSWIGIHLPLAVVFLFREYLTATFVPGDAIRLDVVLLFPIVCLSLVAYIARLIRCDPGCAGLVVLERRGEIDRHQSFLRRENGTAAVLSGTRPGPGSGSGLPLGLCLGRQHDVAQARAMASTLFLSACSWTCCPACSMAWPSGCCWSGISPTGNWLAWPQQRWSEASRSSSPLSSRVCPLRPSPGWHRCWAGSLDR